MNDIRQISENYLDPMLGGRISCHEINWVNHNKFSTMQTGGGLFFHQIPRSGTMLHRHDFAEILLIASGSVIHNVNSEHVVLPSGSLFFLRPDDRHGFLPAADCDQCEILMLDFDLELFLSLSKYLENDAFLQQLTAPVLPPTFQMESGASSSLYSRALKLNNPAIAPRLRKAQLKILIGELFAGYFIDENTFLSASQIPDWLEDLCRAMRKEENFTAGISRMQKLACRTPGHLCKYFKKYLNKTPTDFINELKINHAARLLADDREDIVLIADKLKFQSLSRFYHLFKLQYGQTPAHYRKYHHGKNQQ